ncbi:hypothetical protein KIW84_065257 [Lathyrus oleraceus]|uniref:Uncharacterized protein n=1 Tax=Pisum sativum TaxID=3888 RepID=A0A9D4WEJ4_PEA|nr:hypothetical protein KIW84_065257 [Pisum sativum]
MTDKEDVARHTNAIAEYRKKLLQHKSLIRSKKLEVDEGLNLNTVECLRGRLLAERHALKVAKEQTESMGKKPGALVVLVDLLRLVVSKDGCGLGGGTMEDEESHGKFGDGVDGVEIGCIDVGWI